MVGPDHSAPDLSGRVFDQTLALMESAAIWLGGRLGWYAALRDGGPLTAADLAIRTQSDARYAQEWLAQQATAGILVLDGDRYTLPGGHAEALLDRDSVWWTEPLLRQMMAAVLRLPELEHAYRTGTGLSWSDYGADMSQAQGDVNRPALLHTLPEEWVPQIPGLMTRLGSGARVADICCGHGWAAIGLALAHPGITVDGYDLDGPAIEQARRNAVAAGVGDRVRFHHLDVSNPLPEDGYDVVIAVECLHDLPDPVGVLQVMAGAGADDAVVLVVEMAADPELRTPGDEIQRALYGFSLLVCLPDSRSVDRSVASGTLLRPAVLDDYARRGGFAGATALDLPDTGFWRFYRLR